MRARRRHFRRDGICRQDAHNGAIPICRDAASFKYVDTGNALPAWANAVIMIEKVHQIDEHTLEIFESVAPWNHVRLVGEDVVATELLLPRAHRLRPYDLGALLAAGHTTVRVKARPKVGIIPTGDELIQPGEETKPGAVIDFNSTVLASFVREWGGAPIKYPRARDDMDALMQAVRRATEECDVVTIIAGSSAGEHDLTADVVAEAGELLAHGIDVMPGKPAVLGSVGNKPLLGVPGYPVSAIVIAREILRPALEKFLGSAAPCLSDCARRRAEKNRLASRLGGIHSCYLGPRERKASRGAFGRGAGVITTMVHADGLMRIPSLVEGLNAGEEAEVELLRPIADIENTILCTGSHDLAIGVLGRPIETASPGPQDCRHQCRQLGRFAGASTQRNAHGRNPFARSGDRRLQYSRYQANDSKSAGRARPPGRA